jgi:hypothetical protein
MMGKSGQRYKQQQQKRRQQRSKKRGEEPNLPLRLKKKSTLARYDWNERRAA